MQYAKSTRGTMRAMAQLLVVGGLAAGLTGCNEAASRLNAPPQGATSRPHELRENYIPMVDNAMLAEMSMSSVHFVSNSGELNALGVRRLKRYAEIMRTYGGTLHYDGVDDEDDLAQDRLNRLGEFLVAAGVPRDSFSVERGLAGGSGMNGQEARDIREATNFSVEQQGGESTASDGTLSSTQ